MEKATFGAGCFWGIEAGFRKVKGVSDVTVGYAGGTTDNPTYEQVCSGMTGHAEVVEVNFDSDQVSFEELLESRAQAVAKREMDRLAHTMALEAQGAGADEKAQLLNKLTQDIMNNLSRAWEENK